MHEILPLLLALYFHWYGFCPSFLFCVLIKIKFLVYLFKRSFRFHFCMVVFSRFLRMIRPAILHIIKDIYTIILQTLIVDLTFIYWLNFDIVLPVKNLICWYNFFGLISRNKQMYFESINTPLSIMYIYNWKDEGGTILRESRWSIDTEHVNWTFWALV